MLKLVKRAILPTIFIGIGLLIGTMMSTSANTGLINPNQPGSVNDPIVTKSYVDQVLADLGLDSGSASGDSVLDVVELRTGQSLTAFEGTEFIVRNGKAISYSQTTDGIPNLTTGQDIKGGEPIPNNHLLLFPRNDNRGIRHGDAASVSIWVMIRGSYEHIDINGNVIKKK